MSAPVVPPVDLTLTEAVQRRASDPASSAWVVANAGAGKTHVLTQRVIRLLLAGADPAGILCLTFTKVAAAEMARRVFGELGRWTTLPAPALAEAIAKLQERRPDAAEMARARRLFARALETPGGLKIQTIHAFCERLLHQFPFEANVPGQFTLIDDTAAAALIASARAEAVEAAAADPHGRLGQAFRYLAEHATDAAIGAALDCVLAERETVDRWVERAAGDLGQEAGAAPIDAALADLAGRLGLEPGDSEASLCRAICEAVGWGRGDCAAVANRVADALGSSPHTGNERAAERLRRIAESTEHGPEADLRLELFLRLEEGGWRGFDPSHRFRSHRFGAAFGRANADLLDRFEAESARLIRLAERLRAARNHAATEALLVVGDAILRAYQRAKRAAGHLDFSDLVVKTRNLLSRGEAAAWVLYKLDSRIDHILVDEAQDTSPGQWAVVQALAADFFSGAGAREAARGTGGPRTIFAVGDDKQSIFGFQGAAPHMLAEMERFFRREAEGAEAQWARQALQLSFRSTTEVLDAVDRVFSGELRDKVTRSGYEIHAAHRLDQPGRVIVMPRIVRRKRAEPEDWTTSPDAATAAEVELAEQIAGEIERLKSEPLSCGKRVDDGDVLILVRRRDAFVGAMSQALRRRRIAAAGADRIPIATHIASLDLLALADVMLLPDDDLQLAECLKSPLVGLSDDQLMAVAAGRSGSLWQALAGSTDPVIQAAYARLSRWRKAADQAPPFRFFAEVLGPDGGRRAFRERLGHEPDEVLDAFLSQALAYEAVEAPSLQGFLSHLRASRSDIKREAEAKSRGVRIMTVHGAKGLESDIVFLVDTGGQIVPHQHRDILVKLEDPGRGTALLWRRPKGAASPLQESADADVEERLREEYFRLLYVGMTRARDVLVICGIRAERGEEEGCWYSLAARALVPDDAERDGDTGELAATCHWPQPPRPRPPCAATETAAAPLLTEAPAWLGRMAPPVAIPPRPLRPSRALAEPDPPAVSPAGGAEASFWPGQDLALRRGRAVHRMLQVLPVLSAEERDPMGARIAREALADQPALADAAQAEAEAVLALPELAPLFGPSSRAEVAIVGTIAHASGPCAVSGRIDRIARDAAGWQILDFKTDRAVPATLDAADPAVVLQMALYRRLLADLDPGVPVRAALVWTAGPKVMPIPTEVAEAALARLGQ